MKIGCDGLASGHVSLAHSECMQHHTVSFIVIHMQWHYAADSKITGWQVNYGIMSHSSSCLYVKRIAAAQPHWVTLESTACNMLLINCHN